MQKKQDEVFEIAMRVIAQAVCLALVLTVCQAKVSNQGNWSFQKGHIRDVTFVGWAKDGKSVLSFSAADGEFRLWDPTNGRLLASTTVGTSNNLRLGLAFSISFVAQTGGWEVRGITSREIIFSIPDRAVHSAMSPDGRRLASSSLVDHVILITDVATKQIIRTLQGHPGVVRALAFSPDSQVLASANGDATVTLRSAVDGRILKVLEGHEQPVTSVAFGGPGGQRVGAGSVDGSVRVWDSRTGTLKRAYTGHRLQVRAVSFLSSEEVISGSDDRSVHVWRVSDGALQQRVAIPGERRFTASTGCCGSQVESFGISPSGRSIAIGCIDGFTYLWDRPTNQLQQVSRGWVTYSARTAATFTGEDRWTWVTTGNDDEIRVSTKELAIKRRVQPTLGRVVPLTAIAASGRIYATGDLEGVVRVWNTDWAQLHVFRGMGEVIALTFSQDASLLAASGEDQSIQVWSLSTGKRLWSADLVK